jgi:RND family efflux transporter MFP subunit
MSDSTIVFPSEATLGKRRRRVPGVVAAALLLVCVAGAVVMARVRTHESAVRYSQEAAYHRPLVNAVSAAAAPPVVDLVLPGNTEAVVVADIYARATGYVKARYANIGDKVRASQALALIESPELDQELVRARAALEESRAAWRQAQANVTRSEQAATEARARLEQSQANEALASATSERWTRLVQKGVLPRQEGDERQFAYSARKAEVAAAQASIQTADASTAAAQAGVVAAQANVQANAANVARLERMVAFERVVAPFDGVVTERMVEQGDLIASSGDVGGRKLFAVAQPSILRVQVNVPQTFAPDLKVGQEAELTVRERPGLKVSGKVARTANALNASSRTLLVEVQVDNRNGALLPGMFSEVKFALTRTRPATLIPADALLANTQGTRVAMVDAEKKIRFRTVAVGRDLGTQVEIVDGLQPNDALVVNPGENLAEGQEVEVAAPAAK